MRFNRRGGHVICTALIDESKVTVGHLAVCRLRHGPTADGVPRPYCATRWCIGWAAERGSSSPSAMRRPVCAAPCGRVLHDYPAPLAMRNQRPTDKLGA